jgi:hypothetical protein
MREYAPLIYVKMKSIQILVGSQSLGVILFIKENIFNKIDGYMYISSKRVVWREVRDQVRSSIVPLIHIREKGFDL